MALREINLIPGALLQRRYMRRHGVLWAVAYALVLAVLLAAYLTVMRDVVTKRRTPMSEKEVRRRIAVTISEIESKKVEVERLAFVREVGNIHGTSETLGHLADIMDPKTWLSTLSIEADRDHGYRLMMQGRAFSNARLGATIRALTADEHIANVALRSSSEAHGGPSAEGVPAQLIQFNIEARIAE